MSSPIQESSQANSQRIAVVQIESPETPIEFNPSKSKLESAPSNNGKIQFREQKGPFQQLRSLLNSALVLLFFVIPFISYQGKQAILFDIDKQQFHFFSLTLWPQDFTLLAWVFIAAAFALFFITVFWGRVWCGFLCPQTAWTFMYVWIESRIEGSSNKRKLLDKAPWTADKLMKRTSKHTSWALVALLTGCGFIGYFVPARELYLDIFSLNASFWVSSWVWFFAICTYLNAGWMREQMCLHCCPYSRFQAVMFDGNTKTVTYDAARGESRGPRKRNQATELGDCVDCNLCVDVCPTGIDIRNGLQYECINCGACVDACNQTMDQFGYAPNLISFISENALKGEAKPFWKSARFVSYGLALMTFVIVTIVDLSNISEIQFNIIRDRQSLYREVGLNEVENTYQLKIRNKTQASKQYQIILEKPELFELMAPSVIQVSAAEQLEYPVTVKAKQSNLPKGRATVVFWIVDSSDPEHKVSQSSSFFSPS